MAFAHIPVDDYSSKEVLTYTLGYWEESIGVGQDQLYPAYVMLARYESPGVAETYVVTDYTYIPASAAYARPLARIESHSDLSDNIMAGEVLTFTASDASLTLAELGYHGSLTFTLGTGPEYTYDWYLGTMEQDNHIGTGRELTHTVGAVIDPGAKVPVPQVVILVVTDLYSAHSSQKTNSDMVAYNVIPPVFLPTVLRDHGEP